MIVSFLNQILIYDKALKLSLSSMSSGDTTGQIVNLISVDVAAVQQVIQHMAFIIATPINLILSFAFLVWKLGIVAVMSLAVFLIVIPLQIRLIQTQQIAQKTYLLHADARIKKATEILQSVKILKMYGWEELFASTIKNIRGDEMKQISVVGLHTLFSGGIAKILPVIIPLVIFVLHLAISSTPLTPDLVFTVLPLANMLIEILYMVPFNIACVTEGLSSVKRIECFLSDDDDDDDSRPECYKKEDIENDDNIDEVCEYLYLKNEPSDVMPLVSSNKLLRYDATSDNRTSLMVKTITEPGTAVKIENGNFGWGHSENILALKNISIDIPTGKLTMVIGKIASGKSSLIMALLGEITGYSGSVEYRDNAKISYASQTAWLLNATLRDNIIFWKDFDQVRYNAVLEACALKQDIQILPGGDMTEIGARGINLSGGQKQRISLARALYAKTDVVILDDPLSALDVHVGDYVMKEAILNFLLGDRRTVILATHHYKYIEYANKVVVMENGQISHQGSVSHIQKNFPELFEHLKNMFDDNNSDEGTSRNITSPMGYSDNSTTDKRATMNKLGAIVMTHVISLHLASLVVEEEQQQGPISWSTLYEYANFLTIPMVLLTLLLLIICTGAYVVNYLWLSKWAQAEQNNILSQRIWSSIDGIVFAIIQILTSVIVNTIVNPLFSITLIPFVVVSYLIKKYYLGIARLERRFQLRLHESIERNSLCQIFVMTSTAWIANAMLQICNLFVLTCGMCSLLACVYYNLEPSFVGLAITTSITVYDGIGSTIYDLLDYQTCMNSVERIIEYTHVPSESYKGSCIPHDNWPDTGSIELKHVSARYAETSNPVLHNITLQFKPGEKIGICGRTGSGKSSLSLTLIRMIDVFQGQIIIDGIDISQVPLLILRKRMSIIPQDPHLFAGTIRFNLDPEGRYTNEKLWNALHIAQLKDTVEMMRGRLDEQIPEGGDTFSAGQKQLFCLARAFLRKSRILIMDEATSSIDFHTDAILQNVISTSFADKTVLTIAHRISTILESDTILVLSDGEVIEYDTPTNLLKNNKNMFASLVNASQ
ncbi:ATP-binding cassette sub-family C member 9-like [Saccoglossus kowalevskii]|uniref:ATP-binding cassette sub-family C member 9-like n=1 Tax=Saccoglossus kowalevskii TaxID=10224 RepID=A0ABM0M543_SACKO|nr:PREDICTED: ATP-binding cassette sub-family C member 9-like [Saccoglossus kowalevskii]